MLRRQAAALPNTREERLQLFTCSRRKCVTHRSIDVSPARPADTYRKNDVLSIQESVINHVEYTLARSRYRFDAQVRLACCYREPVPRHTCALCVQCGAARLSARL